MSVRLALGGDVNFSRARGQIALLVQRRRPSLSARLRRRLGRFLPLAATGDEYSVAPIERILLPEYGGCWQNPESETDPGDDRARPWRGIGPFFRAADLGIVNLETPLSDGGRHVGSFRSSPEYARTLAQNNVGLVSIANNHAFDAGEAGFLDTLNALRGAGVRFAGGGPDVATARAGTVVTVGGLRLGMLAYTATCNSFFTSLAKADQPGILPLYEPLVLEDIAALRPRCDFLLVAPHFDTENTARIHPRSIALARRMIDGGADLVLGSHSHVAKAIELYRGRLIVYSLGNLIFPYVARGWGDNLVAEVVVSDAGHIERARFFPLHGAGPACLAPSLGDDESGRDLLRRIRRDSAREFGLHAELRQGGLEVLGSSSRSGSPGQPPAGRGGGG